LSLTPDVGTSAIAHTAECYATLPGRKYYSDDIEDAIFDNTQCKPPYIDWTVRVNEAMSASNALVKRYNKYFSAENQQSIKEKTVEAKVGKQKLRARDLNTLAPKTWLNDNVIDVMTQVLVGRAVTESRQKVAVFDTQFTKLVLEQPTGKGPRYYVYEKAVGVAEKRLLGKSPLDFYCLLFPNAINRNHWNIMAVFPKERLIVALDSMRIGSVKDARINFRWLYINFRWLYDEMKYKHPADANTLFQPYQQDLGWKYTVDTEIAVQGDYFSWGVFVVGYFHCLLFGMNPRHLTPALMAEYRKRIFGAMHSAKVVEYGPSTWMAYNPVKRIQDPLPALANAVSRSIKNKKNEAPALSTLMY
jgi:hypothetical protein